MGTLSNPLNEWLAAFLHLIAPHVRQKPLTQRPPSPQVLAADTLKPPTDATANETAAAWWLPA